MYSSFKGNAATQYGHDQEPATRDAYLQRKQMNSPNIYTTASGLVIHPVHHWLAASPDHFVYDPASPDPFGLVEYKNPYQFRSSKLLTVANEAKNFCLVNKNYSLSLKHTHAYYYQVQATMFCTRRKWCDFVVKTQTDLHIERIVWDSTFWSAAMVRLREFYFTAILPELVVPHRNKGGIREPSVWLKDKTTWMQETESL